MSRQKIRKTTEETLKICHEKEMIVAIKQRGKLKKECCDTPKIIATQVGRVHKEFVTTIVFKVVTNHSDTNTARHGIYVVTS